MVMFFTCSVFNISLGVFPLFLIPNVVLRMGPMQPSFISNSRGEDNDLGLTN